jgi:hypothetical protein
MRHFAHAKWLTICLLWVFRVIYIGRVCGALTASGAVSYPYFASSYEAGLLPLQHDASSHGVCSERLSGLTRWGAIRPFSVSVIFNNWWKGRVFIPIKHQNSFMICGKWSFRRQYSTMLMVRSTGFVWNLVELPFLKKWNSSVLRVITLFGMYL